MILRGEREFSLLNLINIKTTNAALNFNFEEQEATLSGKFNIPSLNDLELDWTEDNYVQVRNSEQGLEYELVADFMLNGDINIYDWTLKDINVNVNKTYDNSTNEVTGSANLYTPNNQSIAFNLAFANGRLQQVSGSSPVGTDFTLFGTDVDIRNITFKPDINPRDNDAFDPELQAKGIITLPEALGRTTVDITGSNYLIINSQGIDLTGGKLIMPNFDVNILGWLEVKGKEVTLDYYKENSQEYFKIR